MMSEYPALPAFALALVALFLKTTMTSLLQVAVRFRTRSFSAPEDAKWAGVPLASVEANLVQRCNSVWRNDVENLPLFLALALSYVLLGATLASASKLFAVYVALRYLHTAVYLRGLQPWRAIFYLGGIAVCCVIAVQIIRMLLVVGPV
ncbi:MAPEG family protein [Herbaspirillum sp. GCM10030257]|uniref:MAPEG family protein n=1 Tax=Herbaspirillum sp. GCM10030257 TaxID=3273393 RepID=UPI003614B679